MGNESDLTADRLLKDFYRALTDINVGRKALADFSAVEDKSTFLEPTIQFLTTEKEDRVRSWGTNVLEMIGGPKAFQWLVDNFFRKTHTQEIKRRYLYTRFFALRAIARVAKSDGERQELSTLLENIWQDAEEDYLTRAEAAILLAQQDQYEPEVWLKEMLKKYEEFWPITRTLRALWEFPLPSLAEDIIRVISNSDYIDHQLRAIEILGAYTDNLRVVRKLGDVIVSNPNEYLRLRAVMALARLQNPAAQADLVHALQDSNAEIRVQASKALRSFLSPEDAASTIIQQALRPETPDEAWPYLTGALRWVDPDRTASTEILSKELASEDPKRAEEAERILIELGGRAAVQRLNQRRSTLKHLDELLAQSERALQSTFQGTIRQARVNFYFALAVNILVVLVGLELVILAIIHLVQNPEKLETWIIPGGAGILGVLINLVFNNPRQNARKDLLTLINVNVIYLGFLRALNEIDATFKHIYLREDFGTTQMHDTVEQIEAAVAQTLNMAARHVRGLQQPSESEEGRASS